MLATTPGPTRNSAPSKQQPLDQLQNRKANEVQKYTPQHTKHETPRNTPSNTPWNTQRIRNSCIFGLFFWYFRGIFSIPCRRGNLYVGLVFLAYFGVCGGFCSVAGSWVVKPSKQESSSARVPFPFPISTLSGSAPAPQIIGN